MDPQLQRCIDECLNCHRICLQTAMNHCLEQGGEHTEPRHFRTMLACAEICQTSANVMLMGSELHKLTCGVCAQVCEECARSCEGMNGMEECARICRSCAEHCRQMAA